ncbi:MAG TPA: hypothetical protein ENK32_07260 [Anaerolineae bacterium]|nr:hypothetical protein [Anaerolineae bacterium]
MNELIFLIVGPFLAALIIGLLNRWPKVAAGLGALAAFGFWLTLKMLALPAATGQQTADFLGQTALLNEGTRGSLLFIYAGLVLLFLLAVLFPQGRKFVPGSLAVLGLLAAALMLRPFTYGVISLWLALALVTIIIQEEQAGQTRAALTYLLLVSAAMPLLLLAVWLVETQPTTLVTPITRLALMGFVILLAGFPFHVWVTAVIRRAPPLAAVFVLGLVQLVIVVFASSFLQAAPWLSRDPQFGQMVRLSGTAVLLAAGLMAVTAVQWPRFLGSLALLNMGLILLTLPGSLGWETAVSLQLAQFAGLLLTAVGGLLLRRQNAASDIRPAGVPDGAAVTNRGLARRAPFSLALYSSGALALLGLPLTLGFGPHWLALRTLAGGTAVWLPALALFAVGLGAFALFRAVLYWLEPAEETAVSPEPRWLQAVLTILLLAILWFSLNPASLLTYSSRLAALFS